MAIDRMSTPIAKRNAPICAIVGSSAGDAACAPTERRWPMVHESVCEGKRSTYAPHSASTPPTIIRVLGAISRCRSARCHAEGSGTGFGGGASTLVVRYEVRWCAHRDLRVRRIARLVPSLPDDVADTRGILEDGYAYINRSLLTYCSLPVPSLLRAVPPPPKCAGAAAREGGDPSS